jgi:hypothetical protein
MGRRALSIALAGSTLIFSLWLSTLSVGVLGAVLFFPFLGAQVIAGMMAVRVALVRKAAAPPDPTLRALEVIALGWILAPGVGVALMFCSLGSMEGTCGLAGFADVAVVLGLWGPVWGAGEMVVIVALVRRGADVVALPWFQAAATVVTLIVAPPLVVLACVTTWSEIDRGGAGTVVLVPAALATGSAVVTWTLGRSLATAAALRRVVSFGLILGVALFAFPWREPLRQTCKSFWTTGTWALLSVRGGTGLVLLGIAGLLFFTRDPLPAD